MSQRVWRLHKLIFYAFLIVGLYSMAVNNPTRDQYNLWIGQQITNNTENTLVQTVVNVFSKPILNASTTQTNYILFSVFETDLGVRKVKVLGIFNHFVPLNRN